MAEPRNARLDATAPKAEREEWDGRFGDRWDRFTPGDHAEQVQRQLVDRLRTAWQYASVRPAQEFVPYEAPAEAAQPAEAEPVSSTTEESSSGGDTEATSSGGNTETTSSGGGTEPTAGDTTDTTSSDGTSDESDGGSLLGVLGV